MTMRQRPLPIGLYILLVLLAPAMSSEGAESDAAVRTTVQWKPEQICLSAHDEHPWWIFPVTARFTHQATGRGLVLEGYWAGDREWVVRFAAPLPGTWTWETSSIDGGLDGHRGRLEVRRPTEEEIAGNPNYRGQLEISENGRYFQYADGTPRFLLADTLWADPERCFQSFPDTGATQFPRMTVWRSCVISIAAVDLAAAQHHLQRNSRPSGLRAIGRLPLVVADPIRRADAISASPS